jgi:hypothetical protein
MMPVRAAAAASTDHVGRPNDAAKRKRKYGKRTTSAMMSLSSQTPGSAPAKASMTGPATDTAPSRANVRKAQRAGSLRSRRHAR